MEEKLVRVFHNQLIDKESLEFDLFNTKGVLMFEKGKKIDPNLLLVVNSINLYKKEQLPEKKDFLKEEKDNIKEFEEDEISQFLKELLFMSFKKQANTVELEVLNDNISILIYKDLNLIEKSELDVDFYDEILFSIKTLFEVESGFDKKEYSKTINLNLFDESTEITLRLTENKFKKLNIIFKIENNRLIDLKNFYLSKNNYEKLEQIKNYQNGIFVFAEPQPFLRNEFVFSLIDKIFDCSEVNVLGPYEKYENHIELMMDISKQFSDEKQNIIILKLSKKEKINESFLNLASGSMIFLIVSADNMPETFEVLTKTGFITKNNFNALKMLIFQKLENRLCSDCKKQYKESNSVLNHLFDYSDISELWFYKKDSCEKCFNTGFSAKLPIHEILLPDLAGLDYDKLIKLINKNEYVEFTNEYDDLAYDSLKKILRGFAELTAFYSIKK